MIDLKVPAGDRKSFESGYQGNILASALFAENEDLLYKCMCFDILDSIYWQRLYLTNKKIIRLWRNQVRLIYLNSIDTIHLAIITRDNFRNYANADKLEFCLNRGDTPFFLFLDDYRILLNNADDAMTLLAEINKLICE